MSATACHNLRTTLKPHVLEAFLGFGAYERAVLECAWRKEAAHGDTHALGRLEACFTDDVATTRCNHCGEDQERHRPKYRALKKPKAPRVDPELERLCQGLLCCACRKAGLLPAEAVPVLDAAVPLCSVCHDLWLGFGRLYLSGRYWLPGFHAYSDWAKAGGPSNHFEHVATGLVAVLRLAP